MSTVAIIAFLKAILPTKKIAAWVLGVIAAALALFMGVNNEDLKAQYCKDAVVQLPTQVIEQLPATAPEVKK